MIIQHGCHCWMLYIIFILRKLLHSSFCFCFNNSGGQSFLALGDSPVLWRVFLGPGWQAVSCPAVSLSLISILTLHLFTDLAVLPAYCCIVDNFCGLVRVSSLWPEVTPLSQSPEAALMTQFLDSISWEWGSNGGRLSITGKLCTTGSLSEGVIIDRQLGVIGNTTDVVHLSVCFIHFINRPLLQITGYSLFNFAMLILIGRHVIMKYGVKCYTNS